MRTLVLFLEEPSTREMLKGLLPRLLPDDVATQYVVFEGKQDLEKRLILKLRSWLKPDSFFMVIRDQDAADCRDIKSRLQRKCDEAGRSEAVVRIACHELESWYLGDLAAVEVALSLRGLREHQSKAKFRDPDSIPNPSEVLLHTTSRAYQKVAGSRLIGAELSIENNRSKSFQAFISGLKRLLRFDH